MVWFGLGGVTSDVAVDVDELFIPDRASNVPLAGQLAEAVRRAFREGRLAVGDILPAAGAHPHVGRSTVLEAYRILAAEGMVTMSPSKGTRVIGQVIDSHYGIMLWPERSGQNLYRSQMLAELLGQLVYEGRPPVVYYLTEPSPTTVEEVESGIPDHLRRDLAENRLKGMVLPFSNHPHPVDSWLKAQRLPVVSIGLGQASSHSQVILDVPGAVRDGYAQLVDLGCRRIAIIDHHADAYLRSPGEHAALLRWTLAPDAIVTGRQLAAHLLSQPQLPDALIVLDDIMALGLINGLQAAGIVIGRDMIVQLAVITSQLSSFFDSCIRWSCTVGALAAAAAALLAEARRKPMQVQDVHIPLTLET